MRALTVVQVRGVPWWGVLSAAVTPVMLIGGWTVAAHLQAQPFDPVRQSVSTLAGHGATDSWVMTLTLIAVAICYFTTALALRPAARTGRLVLIAAAMAGILVALSPVAAPGGFSLSHAVWSAVGFALLAAWPLGAYRSGPGVPWGLRVTPTFGAVFIIVVLTGWFLVELVTGGGELGLAERVLGIAQATWPLLVVISCQLNRSRLSI
jgi:hypothetical membrane protein